MIEFAAGRSSTSNRIFTWSNACVWVGVTLFARIVTSTSALLDDDVPPIPRACLPPHDKYPFCDPALPLSDRLDDLIHRLTLDEKPFLLTARESPKGNISRLGIPECKIVLTLVSCNVTSEE